MDCSYFFKHIFLPIPLVTKVLAKSPNNTIITGNVEPPHMAAKMAKAMSNLSWALENRNWKKLKFLCEIKIIFAKICSLGIKKIG